MTNEEKWGRVVAKMTKQTVNQDISWFPRPDWRSKCNMGEQIVGIPYQATIEAKQFRVYEYRSRYFTEDEISGWESDVAIEMVSNEGELEYRLPVVHGRWALMDAVRSQTSGASDFADGFLKSD